MVDYSRLNEESNNEIRLKTRVHSIGIAQVVIGILCIGLAIGGINQENFTTYTYEIDEYGIRTYNPDHYYYSVGSSFWVIVAGCVAICVNCCSSYKSTLIAHIILASIALVAHLSAMLWPIVGIQNGTGGVIALKASLAFMLAVNFVLLIVSITTASKFVCSCCGSEIKSESAFVQQPVIMIQQPRPGIMVQQPNGMVMMQQPQNGFPMKQPNGMVMAQQPQPGMMVQQPGGMVIMQQQ